MKEIIIGREGNQAIPITDTTVSRRHCRLTISDDGSMTLENLSPSGTKVGGIDIIRKAVSPDSIIGLGPRFSMRLSAIIGPVVKAPAAPGAATPGRRQPSEPPTFNIAHLRRVYDDFNNTNIAMANKQRRINLTRAGLGITTMCTMPLMYVMGPKALIITGIAIVGSIFSLVGMKNAETPAETRRRQDEFEEQWVCPNPACRKSIQSRSYKLLVRNHKACPHCKCKYVEK